MSAGTRLPAADGETVDEIGRWLDEKPTLSRIAAAARRFDALHRRRPELFAKRSVLVVRNFTIEPIEPLLKVAAYRAGIAIQLAYSGYDPAAGEVPEALDGAEPDVVVVALRLEELAPALAEDFLRLPADGVVMLAEDAVQHVVAMARGCRTHAHAPVLVHNFVTPVSPSRGIGDGQDPNGQLNIVRRMNLSLSKRLMSLDGVHVIDVDHLFARLGLRECSDTRGARVSDAPLSTQALRALADALVRHIRALDGPVVKCVVVDCDNTLWGGVVGEDGISRLVLGPTGAGRRHRDLQQSLLDLRRRGVVLALCSKNEQEDVLEVLRTHPDCVLGEDDFAAMRVNWSDKAENITSLAEELNLGLEHLLFIDDNPVECEWIKTRLPEVRVLQWPDGLQPGQSLDDLALFDSLVLTEEDRSRTEMYRAEVQRRAERERVTSIDDYLRSLEMVATVGRMQPQHLARLAQLTLRTNQFNLTTRRHDMAALEELASEPGTEVVWLELSDRFGASGIIGAGIVRVADRVGVIDTLLLSCRVIGRGLEALIVHVLARLARGMGAVELVGEYVPSRRNSQVADLYGRLGFAGPEQRGEATAWRWALSDGLPSFPDWIGVNDQDGLLNDR